MSLTITDQLGVTTKTELKITENFFEGVLNDKNVSGNFIKINESQ